MEKLDPTQRESIKKMSNIRLSAKLLEVGVDESQIQAMDRAQMIAAWAEIVLAGKDKPTIVTNPVGYDPELERKRLEFEMKKYEEEKKKREKRYEEEKLEKERRYEEEKEEREKRYEEEKKREREKVRRGENV